MKNNDEKLLKKINMYCDVHYYPRKFESKIQLVSGEIKKINYIRR